MILLTCLLSLYANSTWIWTGPLVLVAVLYEIIGGLIAWIIKQFFWVPHRFRYGILVAGVFGNVGDIRELCSIIHSSHLNIELLFRSYHISHCSDHERHRWYAVSWHQRPEFISGLHLSVYSRVYGVFSDHPTR